jgi:hypothetical protein
MFYVRLGKRHENLLGEPLAFSINIIECHPLNVYFNIFDSHLLLFY